VVAVIGDVAAQQGRWNWFDSRPLRGISVLVTRARHQAHALEQELTRLGADVAYQPAIDVLPPASWDQVDEALDRIAEVDYLVFSSANGVESFCQRWLDRQRDFRTWGHLQLVALGPGTAQALRRYSLRPDRVPAHEFRAESVVDLLRDEVAGRRCVLIRANRGRDVLPAGLLEAGADVRQVVAYRSVDVTVLQPDVEERLASGTVHWVTATSSSIGRALVPLLERYAPQLRWASISPVTSEALRASGVEADAEATEYTMPGVVQAIVAVVQAAKAGRSEP
jgi:uroporphyrinogen III methyltransferase / synthase